MLFQFLDILGDGMNKLILVWYCNCVGLGRGVVVFLRHIEKWSDLPHHLRHYISDKAKLWVNKKITDLL